MNKTAFCKALDMGFIKASENGISKKISSLKGVRAGSFGPLSASKAHEERNLAVRRELKDRLLEMGFKTTSSDYGPDVMTSVLLGSKQKYVATFTLQDFPTYIGRDKSDYRQFWWVLSEYKVLSLGAALRIVFCDV